MFDCRKSLNLRAGTVGRKKVRNNWDWPVLSNEQFILAPPTFPIKMICWDPVTLIQYAYQAHKAGHLQARFRKKFRLRVILTQKILDMASR
jgi:hypothetical protein